uniref:Uncharacterized protein n=1 Tax=Rhodnius prolixus TaxID=13249 RepID=T1IBU3_RHOPR
MNAAERINDGIRTSASGAVEIMQVDDEIASTSTTDCIGIDCVRSSIMKTHWAAASARFTTTFLNNPFGHTRKCDVCDRLWFLRSFEAISPSTRIHVQHTAVYTTQPQFF